MDDYPPIWDFIKARLAAEKASRYHVIGKYVLDKYIFQLFFLCAVVGVVGLLYANDWELNYFKCDAHYPEVCQNPFYNEHDIWKSAETLPAGEYGNVNTQVMLDSAWVVVIVSALIGVAVNHVAWNLKGGAV